MMAFSDEDEDPFWPRRKRVRRDYSRGRSSTSRPVNERSPSVDAQQVTSLPTNLPQSSQDTSSTSDTQPPPQIKDTVKKSREVQKLERDQKNYPLSKEALPAKRASKQPARFSETGIFQSSDASSEDSSFSKKQHNQNNQRRKRVTRRFTVITSDEEDNESSLGEGSANRKSKDDTSSTPRRAQDPSDKKSSTTSLPTAHKRATYSRELHNPKRDQENLSLSKHLPRKLQLTRLERERLPKSRFNPAEFGDEFEGVDPEVLKSVIFHFSDVESEDEVFGPEFSKSALTAPDGRLEERRKWSTHQPAEAFQFYKMTQNHYLDLPIHWLSEALEATEKGTRAKGALVGHHVIDEQLPVYASYYPDGNVMCRIFPEDVAEEVLARHNKLFESRQKGLVKVTDVVLDKECFPGETRDLGGFSYLQKVALICNVLSNHKGPIIGTLKRNIRTPVHAGNLCNSKHNLVYAAVYKDSANLQERLDFPDLFTRHCSQVSFNEVQFDQKLFENDMIDIQTLQEDDKKKRIGQYLDSLEKEPSVPSAQRSAQPSAQPSSGLDKVPPVQHPGQNVVEEYPGEIFVGHWKQVHGAKIYATFHNSEVIYKTHRDDVPLASLTQYAKALSENQFRFENFKFLPLFQGDSREAITELVRKALSRLPPAPEVQAGIQSEVVEAGTNSGTQEVAQGQARVEVDDKDNFIGIEEDILNDESLSNSLMIQLLNTLDQHSSNLRKRMTNLRANSASEERKVAARKEAIEAVKSDIAMLKSGAPRVQPDPAKLQLELDTQIAWNEQTEAWAYKIEDREKDRAYRLDQANIHLKSAKASLKKKSNRVEELEAQNKEKDAEILEKDAKILEKDAKIIEKDANIKYKDAEIEKLEALVERYKRDKLSDKQEQLTVGDETYHLFENPPNEGLYIHNPKAVTINGQKYGQSDALSEVQKVDAGGITASTTTLVGGIPYFRVLDGPYAGYLIQVMGAETVEVIDGRCYVRTRILQEET